MKVANKNLLAVCWAILVVPLFLAHVLALVTPLPQHFAAVSIYDQGMLFIYPGFVVSVLVGYYRQRPSSFACYAERARFVGFSVLHQIINLGIAMVGVDILFDMLRSMTMNFAEYAAVIIVSAALKIMVVGIYGLANMELYSEWRQYRKRAKQDKKALAQPA